MSASRSAGPGLRRHALRRPEPPRDRGRVPASSRRSGPRIVVLGILAATVIHLPWSADCVSVGFDHPGQLSPIRIGQQPPDAMVHIPGGSVVDVEPLRQLARGDARLRGDAADPFRRCRDQPDRQKPLSQRNSRAMKRRACGHRKVRPARPDTATPGARAATQSGGPFDRPALRANGAIRPANLFQECAGRLHPSKNTACT